MISTLGTSVSAVTSFRNKMDVTANNIANVNTDGFKKSRATLKEGKYGGVETQIQEINTPGSIRLETIDGELTEIESSNVDLAEELTETIITKTGHESNLKTLKTVDDMIGSLLDVIG